MPSGFFESGLLKTDDSAPVATPEDEDKDPPPANAAAMRRAKISKATKAAKAAKPTKDFAPAPAQFKPAEPWKQAHAPV